MWISLQNTTGSSETASKSENTSERGGPSRRRQTMTADGAVASLSGIHKWDRLCTKDTVSRKTAPFSFCVRWISPKSAQESLLKNLGAKWNVSKQLTSFPWLTTGLLFFWHSDPPLSKGFLSPITWIWVKNPLVLSTTFSCYLKLCT